MAWDTAESGKIIATPLKEFEVAAFPEDGAVLLRLVIADTQVQVALGPQFCADLAKDLADASKRIRRH